MSRNADDVLAAAWVARAAGIPDDGFDLVPLFETVDDLRAAEAVMRGLLARPVWSRHLKRQQTWQMPTRP